MSKRQAWSYSSLEAFETCPKRYYLTKVSKQCADPPNEAGLWGNRVHKALELRLKDRTPLPPEMDMFEPMAAKVIAASSGGRLYTEQKLALTDTFRPAKWFDKDVWVRGITDFTIIKGTKALIGDWKTGKPKPDSAQLKLTAAMTMHVHPYVQQVINTFVWIKDDKTSSERFTREDIPAIWQEFMPRIKRLDEAVELQKFPARPSGLCAKYCPVGKKFCDHCGS